MGVVDVVDMRLSHHSRLVQLGVAGEVSNVYIVLVYCVL